MIRLVLSALALAGLCTTATSATEQRRDQSEQVRLERTLKGLKPGAPQRCVSRDRVTETRGFDGEILFVAGRNRIWRNKTVGSCSALVRDDVPVFRTLGRDYCEGDIVQTRARMGGMITGSCALGEFVPYTK